MEQTQIKQEGLRKGFWNELPIVKEEDKRQKIKFELNQPVIVTFEGEPSEWDSVHGDGVFYIFDVQCAEGKRIIMTSSKTMLYGLKSLGEIEGKTAKITKVMKPWSDGMNRQFFEVEAVDSLTFEKVKEK